MASRWPKQKPKMAKMRAKNTSMRPMIPKMRLPMVMMGPLGASQKASWIFCITLVIYITKYAYNIYPRCLSYEIFMIYLISQMSPKSCPYIECMQYMHL